MDARTIEAVQALLRDAQERASVEEEAACYEQANKIRRSSIDLALKLIRKAG